MKFKLFLLSFLSVLQVVAQKQNFKSKSEFGLMGGGAYYIGDLNQYNHFKNSNLSLGLVYKYNVNTRLAFRANALFGTVEANDNQASNAVIVNRNLSFSSTIYEFAAGVEFSYLPFQIGNSQYFGTAYLLTEIGVFQMNPTADLNGDKIDLQSLGTEGQGTSLSSEAPYKKTQLTIPLGIGCKFSIGGRVTLSLEYGIRKTFTDYLDDVHANRYVNADDLAAINGPLSAGLSNRSLDNSVYGKRGNATTKDWYVFYGAMFSIRLGGPRKCNMPR